MNVTDDDTRALDGARFELASIVEHYAAWNNSESDDAQDNERCWALENALDVQVREAWHAPGTAGELDEYTVLLSTGGPACRIYGTLNQHGEPGDPDCRLSIQYQDWGTPWRSVDLLSEAEVDALRWYVSCFWFGGE